MLDASEMANGLRVVGAETDEHDAFDCMSTMLMSEWMSMHRWSSMNAVKILIRESLPQVTTSCNDSCSTKVMSKTAPRCTRAYRLLTCVSPSSNL